MSSWSLWEPQDKKFVHGVNLVVPRWRKSILSDHLLLGGAREQYPCVGAPTWIRGERQLLDTTGKNPVVSCPLPLLQAFNSVRCFSCLRFD